MSHDKLARLLDMCERYRRNLDEIERLQEDTCIVSDSVRGSSSDLPYGLHTIRVAGVDRARAEYNAAKLEILRGEVACVDALLALAPYKVKVALMLRYLDGLPTWDSVAAALNSSGEQTSTDAIKKAVYRYLEKQ